MRLPPPPIVPEAARRGTGGARLAAMATPPPPPPIGTPPSARSTPPDSPATVTVDDTVVHEHSPAPTPPRSLLYSSMPSFGDSAFNSSDRGSGSGSGVRLALGAQRMMRKPVAPSSLSQSAALPQPYSKAVSAIAISEAQAAAGRSSNPGKAISPRMMSESRPLSPPGTPPNLSPRSPLSAPQSPPTSPRTTGIAGDWLASKARSPPGSPPRFMSPPRGPTLLERNTGFYSPPTSPERTLSPPRIQTGTAVRRFAVRMSDRLTPTAAAADKAPGRLQRRV